MRPINLETDYETICAWHRGHGWPKAPKEALSSIGFMDENCAGFLYVTNSTIAWTEFVVGNPESDKEARAKSLDDLMEALEAKAKEFGHKILFTSTQNPAYERRLLKHGWKESDKDMRNYIRVIGEPLSEQGVA